MVSLLWAGLAGSAAAFSVAPSRRALTNLRSPALASASHDEWGGYDLDSVERPLMTERDACGTGFVSEAVLPASRRVVEAALEACECVEHRGACSADGISGDGAGVLTAIPWAVYEEDTPALLEFAGKHDSLGCGMLFLPRDEKEAKAARKIVELVAMEAGFEVVAWRQPPVDPSVLGEAAESGRPDIEMIFVKAKSDGLTGYSLERSLYIFRRNIIGAAEGKFEDLYVASMSSRTVVYKAMCRSEALRQFYPDLDNPKYISKFAIYHRRFSTNTMPRWCLAQPFRLLAHNGEINTIRGNINWMAARAIQSGSDLGMLAACADDLEACEVDSTRLGPVVDASKSDSANLDATCEMYTRAGRSVAEALMLMIPPADVEDGPLVDFFKVHAPLQEPWDGPAGVCFADGTVVGARLDRNGLRPARFTRYADGLVCLSSETGSASKNVPPDSEIVEKGRLGPGQTCVVDLVKGGFYMDAEVRNRIAANSDWKAALKALESGANPHVESTIEETDVVRLTELPRMQTAFGWGAEDVEMQVQTMVSSGKEATFCMGADAPLAILSKYAHPLYDYFKQRHAQVTNPPIDALRERHVMTLEMWVGSRPNCVDAKAMAKMKTPNEASYSLVKIDSPVVDAGELASLEQRLEGKRISTVYSTKESLGEALQRVVEESVAAVVAGAKMVVLSDEGFDPVASMGEESYVPPLLATGAVHYGLIKAGLRLDASIAVETAQCWSTHHVASLVGYGASAVRPYLLYQTAKAVQLKLEKQGKLVLNDPVDNVREALDAGVLKILSKMGISALSSYHGAQTFEAIGLSEEVIALAFKGTPSRLGGLSLSEMDRETTSFVKASISQTPELKVFKLENYGFANSLKNAETHANSPKVAKLLHAAVRGDDVNLKERRPQYQAFAEELQSQSPVSLRDLLTFKKQEKSDSSVDRGEIMKRFVTGGMSLGALSREAHETLAIAMNRIGGASNSGEGGEDTDRDSTFTEETRKKNFGHLRGESVTAGDTASSAIKQVASGRFGVTTSYLATASQIEIKIAQGAKPGEGGQLPAAKVDKYIASIRAATEGVTLISPPPHHDIYSIEDLAQLIFDLKAVNPTALVSVKLVSIAGIGTVACGCAKAGADVVQISGHDGGTGAASLTSIKHAGAPLELGLAEAHVQLVENGLRDRVILRVDGGVRTGRDVLTLALLGAEEFGFGTVAMVAAGCVMARICHTNNCPVGVATQKETLRARARGEPAEVVRYFELVAEDIAERLADLGLGSLREAVGRTDLLEINKQDGFKSDGLALDYLLRGTPTPWSAPESKSNEVRPLLSGDGSHFDDDHIDHDVEISSLEKRLPLTNVDRAVGTRLAGHLARRRHGVSDKEQRSLFYKGSAGQSFGGFAVEGMTLDLEGDANDYVGKGLNGGVLKIQPPLSARDNGIFEADLKSSVIVGNTCLYGATKGELYAAGSAGERFGVRNSGAFAVVEGTGDHACEYMTNGAVVVLGTTGVNVGAGMTGGEAFIYDTEGDAPSRVNTEIVTVSRLPAGGSPMLKRLVEAHLKATGSKKASSLLQDWDTAVQNFWHVKPPAPPPLVEEPVVVLEELLEAAAEKR